MQFGQFGGGFGGMPFGGQSFAGGQGFGGQGMPFGQNPFQRQGAGMMGGSLGFPGQQPGGFGQPFGQFPQHYQGGQRGQFLDLEVETNSVNSLKDIITNSIIKVKKDRSSHLISLVNKNFHSNRMTNNSHKVSLKEIMNKMDSLNSHLILIKEASHKALKASHKVHMDSLKAFHKVHKASHKAFHKVSHHKTKIKTKEASLPIISVLVINSPIIKMEMLNTWNLHMEHSQCLSQ